MKKSRLEIFVGARGWQYPEWSGEFYPDDLPEDWRFSYYSNEMQAILVPFDYLRHYSKEEWAEWVEDTPSDFAFYVELSGAASWYEVSAILEVIGVQLKGIVIVIDKLPDIEALASLIKHAKAMAPVCIHSSGDKVSDQDMQTLRSCHEVNECWNGEEGTPPVLEQAAVGDLDPGQHGGQDPEPGSSPGFGACRSGTSLLWSRTIAPSRSRTRRSTRSSNR